MIPCYVIWWPCVLSDTLKLAKIHQLSFIEYYFYYYCTHVNICVSKIKYITCTYKLQDHDSSFYKQRFVTSYIWHDRFMTLIREVWVHKTCLTPPFLMKCLCPTQVTCHVNVCVFWLCFYDFLIRLWNCFDSFTFYFMVVCVLRYNKHVNIEISWKSSPEIDCL